MKRWWPFVLAGVTLGVAFASLFRGEVQAARDLSGHVFAETWFLLDQWRAGHVPLWLPHARLGQPFAALLYTQVFYAPRVVTGLLFGHVMGPNVMHLLHAGWAFAGVYFALRRLGLQRAFAFIGAAPFSLSPFFVEFAQNLSFASTAAWTGWVLWAAEGLRAKRSLRRVAWLAAVLGASLHAGSPEIWSLQAMLVGLVAVRDVRSAAWVGAGVAWAGALAAIVAFPVLELSRASTAGSVPLGAREWSVSGIQLLSMFIPDADMPRSPGYWGSADQRFIFTLFIGSAAAVFASFGLRVRRARAVAIFAAVAILLSLGRHFALSDALLSLKPFSLFRYPAKYLVGGLFGVSVLAGFGARRLVAYARKGLIAPLIIVAGPILGLWLSSRFEWARDGFRSGAPWLVAALVVMVLLRRRPKALAVFVVLELLFAPVSRWERVSAAALTRSSTLAPLVRGQGRLSIRVDLDDVDHHACGPWDIDSHDPLLDGRDRLSALRFVEEDLRAVGGYGFREPWRLARAFTHVPGAFVVSGVDTFVRETWAPAPAGALSVANTPIEDVWVWRSAPAFPRAWFVNRVEVNDDDHAFVALDRSFDELKTSVVVDSGEPRAGVPCAAQVETKERSATVIDQHVDACDSGVVVSSDAWFPGWSVWVDGQRAVPLRAFGFLRAVAVEAGPHTIEWRYEPLSFWGGALVSMAALAALGFTFLRRKV